MSKIPKTYEAKCRPFLQLIIIELHCPGIENKNTYTLAKSLFDARRHVDRPGPKVETA